jgi:hypothetical protein
MRIGCWLRLEKKKGKRLQEEKASRVSTNKKKSERFAGNATNDSPTLLNATLTHTESHFTYLNSFLD